MTDLSGRLLALVYRNYSFKMGYMALSNLLHVLGSRSGAVRMFEQDLIFHCSEKVAIEGHIIPFAR